MSGIAGISVTLFFVWIILVLILVELKTISKHLSKLVRMQEDEKEEALLNKKRWGL